MKKRLTFFAILALSFLAATAALFGQQATSIRGIDSVPSERRAELLQKVKQFVSMYRVQDWASVYTNLTHLPPIQETSDQFRERLIGAYPRNVKRNLIAFVPESLVQQPTDQWALWGCATLQGKGKKQTKERWMLIASWERGGWFFSELLPATQLDGKKPMACTTK